MKLVFTLDTHGTCVGQLRDELLPLEELANTWEFPYDIFFVLRVLPEGYGRKTSRRFDSRDHTLELDISISYEQYQRMSKHEQREGLGIHLFNYLSESVAKYNKHADKKTQNQLLDLVKKWMLENNWLNGKLNQARKLLSQDMGLYEVSQKLQMPLEEIEYILLRMNDYEPTDIHPDNLVVEKAPPYHL
ncbi:MULTISPECIES: hypothetical protein [Paenibacillus]|uniref:hypothetical protein n=1 Tax=Paenibacillus TaxID=44249 RepID=UPI00096C69C8|nr:hypothetical protein [Paenibacillus odorifer]OMC99198.1 hypothetical protein BJP46_23180 [Paenibacillus odorifer]OMD10362.1 hypothetical protein BJP47_06520 [Paenibacillus odorifer]OMD18842.1 hypothetical protein BJP50_13225 [Paenibacillus odorifer]OMD22093.1 hypothetical protein BJP48_07760 [Paenibacillus odorifer]OME61285.1 hypothetical protein BSK59_03705 [Paenibacillus odorifer]